MNFRNISAWCIRNPVVPIVLFLGLVLAGMITFARMKVQNDPDIEFPFVIVVISQRRTVRNREPDYPEDRSLASVDPGRAEHQLDRA
jgi:hypothetical protein